MPSNPNSRRDVIEYYHTFIDKVGTTFTEQYQALVRQFPDLNASERTIRRWLAADIRRTQNPDAQDEMMKVAKAKNQLLRGQKMNMYQRRELHLAARDQSFREYVSETLIGMDMEAGLIWQGRRPGGEPPLAPESSNYFISDMHYSKPEQLPHVRATFKTIYDDTKLGEKVRLVFLGDDIEGELRQNSMMNGNTGIINSTRTLQVVYAQEIIALAEKVHLKVVYVSKSNHSQIRTNGIGRSDRPDNDVGEIIGDYLALALKGVCEFVRSDEDGVAKDGIDVFLHGHQGFARRSAIDFTFNQSYDVPGKYKRVHIGHYHHYWAREASFGKVIGHPAAKNWKSAHDSDRGYRIDPRIICMSTNEYGEEAYALLKIIKEEK